MNSAPGSERRRAAGVAFTLVELLVVISIIALLAGLSLSALSSAKASSRSAACLGNLHQIGIALQIYVDANNNRLPFMRDASTNTNAPPASPLPPVNVVLPTELGNLNVLRCPSDQQGVFETTGSSYSWNSLLNGEKADSLTAMGMNFNPHAIPVFYDKDHFHAALGSSNGINYLYADGHIKNLLTIQGTIPP